MLGLALGGLTLTRENALVFVVVIVGWTLTKANGIRHALLVVAGVAIVLLPVAARNSYVGGGFYVTTSQFGPNFYIGNNARADGTYAPLRYGRGAPEYERTDATEIAERALGRQLTPSEVSSYWSDRALTFMASHPGAWVKLLARKFALLWNATEMVDTESQETYAEWSWPLRVLGPFTHFGVLVPLALVGLIVMRRQENAMVLVVLTGAYAASVLVFYVFARYRYPLVPLLMVFASVALVTIPELVRDRRIPGGPATVAALAVAIVFVNWPIVSGNWMRAVSETNIGAALQGEHRLDEAIAHYRRALALRSDYAPAANNIGTALRASGRVDEAIAAYRRALDIQPDFPDAQYNFANALLDKGDADEAIARFQSAIQSMPPSADVHNNLGIALAAANRPDEALREFERVLQIDPDSAVAHRNIGDLLESKGDRTGALSHLRRAIQLDPANSAAHYDLGRMLLEAGVAPEAERELRAALAGMSDSPEAHNNLGIAVGSQGRMDEAIGEFREALRLQPSFADAQRNLQMSEAARRAARPRP